MMHVFGSHFMTVRTFPTAIRRLFLGILLNAATFFPASPSSAGTSPWPMFRHDVRHTGRTLFTGPAKPVVAWKYSADGSIGSSPVLGNDGSVYFGTGLTHITIMNGSFNALTPDGALKWSIPALRGFFSSAAIGPDSTIYVGSLDNFFYAIADSITYPHILWKKNIQAPIYSSPSLGPDGSIYFGTVLFHVQALTADGTVRWRYKTNWCVFSSPALLPNGMLYIGSKDENLYAFQEDGTKVWQASTGAFYDGYLVDSSPAVGDNGTIYVGTDPYGAAGKPPVPVDRAFFAINPDGSIKWRFTMKDGAESSPAIAPDGTIYVGSDDGNLYALEDRGGSVAQKWSYHTGGWIDGSPVVDGCGVIYVGSRDGYLYALNPDGTLRWRYLTDGEIESSPAIDGNGRLYVGTFNGSLYCFGETGPDVGVKAINSPQKAALNSNFYPSARISAYRSGSFTPDVSCTISRGDQVLYHDTVRAVPVNGGEIADVLFSPWLPSETPGDICTVSFSTLLPGDNNAENDTLAASLEIIDETAGISESGDGLPRELAITACFPNPFNASTTVGFEIPQSRSGAAMTRVSIYDVGGRLVRTILQDNRKAGRYSIGWNGRDGQGNHVSSGVYIVSLSAGTSRKAAKILFLK